MPHSTEISDKTGKLAIQVADLKKLLEQNLERCVEEVKKLTEYINSVPDSEMRIILKLRYIENFTWQKIAYKINSFDESVPRKRHNCLLTKCEICDTLLV